MFDVWIILSLFSAFFFGIKDVLSKKILNEKTKPTQLIFIEYIMLFFGILFIRFQKINFLDFFSTYYLFFLKTISLFCFSYIYFKLLENHDVSLISPLTNLSPVFLLMLSSIFLFEKTTFIQLIGILIIIVSTYLLEINLHHHKQKKPHNYYFEKLKKLDWKTVNLVILMLILISITGISDKFIFNQNISIDTNIFWTSALILTFVLCQIIFSKQTKLIKSSFSKQNIIMSFFTNISTVLILMAISIPNANISLVVPIKRTSTLFSSIFGGLLFHEKHILKKLISTVGMLIGIVLIAL